MTNGIKLCCLCLLVCQLSGSLLSAAKQAPPAPIPAPILAAKRIFIANAGWDTPFYYPALFSGGSTRAYDQFYAAMKSWGRYELVASPSDADLIVQVQFSVYVPPEVRTGNQTGLFNIPPYDAQFRVEIRDPKSNALLWAFVEHAEQAILQVNRDKNFDLALGRIVGDVQVLGAEPPAAPDSTAKP